MIFNKVLLFTFCCVFVYCFFTKTTAFKNHFSFFCPGIKKNKVTKTSSIFRWAHHMDRNEISQTHILWVFWDLRGHTCADDICLSLFLGFNLNVFLSRGKCTVQLSFNHVLIIYLICGANV